MTGMIFGVFDGLHQGHRYFISEARKKCDKLVVVLTLPEIVMLLKNKTPKHTYEKRAADLLFFDNGLEIIPSDQDLGEWNIFKDRQPDIIFLGYDQHGIAKELEKLGKPFEFIAAHHPEKYKSSLLNTN